MRKFLLQWQRRLGAYIRKEPKLVIFLIATLLIAIILRTYAYFDRIYVYADDSLFVQAAYYAFANGKIPQIGPFAQAPFFTGPWWLWILAISFIFPFGLLTPWYMMSALSVFFVVLIYFAGKEIGGERLGALSALLAAVSTAQIDNSFMTWNAAADPFLGLLATLFFLKYLKEQKASFLFLLGFCVSLAVTIHFQTSLLSPLILVALIAVKPRLRNLFALTLGIAIPLLPFLYFDLRFNWFETRRILDYVMIAQYRIYVPNRWLTYAGVFWPNTWTWILGGKQWLGYLLMGLVSLISIIRLKDFRRHRNYYLIALAFGLSVVMLRYFRGERQFYYTNYAHAFVILLTAWTLLQICKFNKIPGFALTLLVLTFTVKESFANITPRVITYAQVNRLVDEIYLKYPSSTFAIYECPFQSSLVATPVSYKMYYEERNSLDGIKIGVCNENFISSWREIEATETDEEYEYKNKSTPKIYTDMTEWWVSDPPGPNLY